MTYELAHRSRPESSAELAAMDAPSSWAAVEQLRRQIPPGHVVLSARPLDQALGVDSLRPATSARLTRA